MSKTKFTPGPWVAYLSEPKLNVGHATVESASGSHIMNNAVYKSDMDESFANAVLISAAPELYAALEMVVYSNNECVEGGFLTHEEAEAINSALAKARGES